MKSFYLKSMGCKSNQFEGQIAAENLKANGFKEVNNPDKADYYILNSCSVTHKSDNEALYFLRRAHSTGAKTILTGCIAQIEKENMLKESSIDYVFGNEDKFEIAKHLKNKENFAVTDLMNKSTFCNTVLEDSDKTRISLKIQDG